MTNDILNDIETIEQRKARLFREKLARQAKEKAAQEEGVRRALDIAKKNSVNNELTMIENEMRLGK